MASSILLIENNNLSRRNIAAFLEGCGYLVSETEDGDEALKLIKDIAFDVVITDLRLDGMVNGLDILECHKQVCPDGKSFLITAFGTDQVKERAMSLGAIYLEKPIQLNDLVNRIKSLTPA
ncbi:MAG: response regulator [Deltaproteobacteria bacterium]|nr:response regulator [Deltaproteobacteria bacterium]